MAKRKVSKQARGGTRMAQLAYKPIQVWVDSHDMSLLREAAEFDVRPLSRFVLVAALQAARELILKKIAGGSVASMSSMIAAASEDEPVAPKTKKARRG